MRIGYDGKRAVQNFTGLGNYSRYVVQSLSAFAPETSIGCMLRYTVKISNSRRWWPKAGERYRYIIHLIGSGEE